MYVAAEVLATDWLAGRPVWRLGLLMAVVAAGVCGVASSVMVYHAVRRPFWRAASSGVKFAGTALVLGLATALASLGVASCGGSRGAAESPVSLAPIVAGTLMVASSAKLWWEAGDRRERHEDEVGSEPLRRTAWLLRVPLKRPAGLRRFLGWAGGVVLPALTIAGTLSGDRGAAVAAAVLALSASIGGESIERSLFFRAVTRPKMPGGLPS